MAVGRRVIPEFATGYLELAKADLNFAIFECFRASKEASCMRCRASPPNIRDSLALPRIVEAQHCCALSTQPYLPFVRRTSVSRIAGLALLELLEVFAGEFKIGIKPKRAFVV
jgi:hypothetical protein